MTSTRSGQKSRLGIMLGAIVILAVVVSAAFLLTALLPTGDNAEREPLTPIQTEAYAQAMRANLDSGLAQANDTADRADGAEVDATELLDAIKECTPVLTSGTGDAMHECSDRLAIAAGAVQATLSSSAPTG